MRLWGWLLLWASLSIVVAALWMINAILDRIHEHLQMHLDDEQARTIRLLSRKSDV